MQAFFPSNAFMAFRQVVPQVFCLYLALNPNQREAGKKGRVEEDGGKMLIAVVLERSQAEDQSLI